MEVPVEMNSRVVAWLASMGYPVEGMPREMLRQMLLREARQWQIAPSKLAALINEGARQPGISGIEAQAMRRESSGAGRTTWFVGSH